MDGWIERHRSHIIVVLCNLVLLGAAVFMLRRPPSPQGPVLQIATAPPTLTPIPTPTPAPLRVYVSGAVSHPNVYQLPPDSIVKDALAAAGGALPGADLTRVNLAQQLFDQQQIHVPLAGETPPPVSSSAQAPSSSGSGCVDINSATLEELDRLPGIGPAYAQRIIEYRTIHGSFQDVEELTQIKGIGPATLEKIRDLVCVR
jgi:competence protein ComEA